MKRLEEDRLVGLVVGFLPWLTPINTAVLVTGSVREHLDLSLFVSGIIGVVVEGMGLAAIFTAYTFHAHNGAVESPNRRAPFWLAVILSCVYLVTVALLTFFLDTMPQLAAWAPLLFPLLSGTGMTLLTLWTSHQQRVREMILSREAPYRFKRHQLIRARLLAELEGEPHETPRDDTDLQAARAEARALRGEVERLQAEAARFQEPDREDFVGIYAGLNGNRAELDARGVNRALVEGRFYPVPDSTARGWLDYAREVCDG